MKNRKKAIRILLLVVAVIVVGLLLLRFTFRNSDSFLGRVSSYLFNNNSLELVCIGVDSKYVDVLWITENGQRQIVKAGTQVASIGYEYGPNSLLVTLSDSLNFKVGNWKTNKWNSHSYRIEITKDSFGYLVNFEAVGMNYDRTEIHYNWSGEMDGKYRMFYKNGELAVSATYRHGEPEGQIIYYYENGTIRASNEYSNGKANGWFLNYAPDGKVEFQTLYRDGQEVNDTSYRPH